jgi:hypothetical protein
VSLLTLPRIMYGWEVTTSSNDKLDFVNAGVTYAATLSPGVYTGYGFATEVQRAIRAIDTGHSVTCALDHAAKTFTIGAGTATFSLLFGSGANNATNCATLLGFTRGGGAGNDKTGSTSYTGAAVGTSPSTMTLWDLAEPIQRNSPVTAAAAGTAAALLQRDIVARQHRTDGGKLETVYIATFKKLRLTFNELASAEQTKKELLLDWIQKGNPISYMTDATNGSGVLHLVLENPSSIANAFSWPTRSEADYGELVFIEQKDA